MYRRLMAKELVIAIGSCLLTADIGAQEQSKYANRLLTNQKVAGSASVGPRPTPTRSSANSESAPHGLRFLQIATSPSRYSMNKGRGKYTITPEM
jgi:hypothetical protein